MNRPLVYLAGYSSEFEYRKYAKDNFSDDLNLWDPMAEESMMLYLEKDEFNTRSERSSAKIVEFDKSVIIRSDVVVAYMERYSAGTIMEILHAYNNDVPVLLIDPLGTFRDDVWIRYHITKAFDDVQSCLDYIIKEGMEYAIHTTEGQNRFRSAY